MRSKTAFPPCASEPRERLGHAGEKKSSCVAELLVSLPAHRVGGWWFPGYQFQQRLPGQSHRILELWACACVRPCRPRGRVDCEFTRLRLVLPVNLRPKRLWRGIAAPNSRTRPNDDRRARMGVKHQTNAILFVVPFASRTRRWPLLVQRAPRKAIPLTMSVPSGAHACRRSAADWLPPYRGPATLFEAGPPQK
jgi:hypothetical protein